MAPGRKRKKAIAIGRGGYYGARVFRWRRVFAEPEILLTAGRWRSASQLCKRARAYRGADIALASEPYALAQDVASAIRLFQGELWYDTSQGVPYKMKILGDSPPLTVFQELMVQAAMTVPGVVSATCIVTSFDFSSRHVDGQVQFKDSNGNTGSVSLAGIPTV